MNLSKRIVFLPFITTLFLAAKASFAAPVTLDFSSGTYSARPPLNYINLYQEDGFSVATQSLSDQFSQIAGTYGPTLAWYESGTVIKIDRGGALFSLNSIDVPIPAFAGLRFESSSGTVVTAGSATGTLLFSGAGWSDISYFTIRTVVGADMLTQLDNVVVTPVPLPAALTLFLSGLAGLTVMKKRRSATA